MLLGGFTLLVGFLAFSKPIPQETSIGKICFALPVCLQKHMMSGVLHGVDVQLPLVLYDGLVVFPRLCHLVAREYVTTGFS